MNPSGKSYLEMDSELINRHDRLNTNKNNEGIFMETSFLFFSFPFQSIIIIKDSETNEANYLKKENEEKGLLWMAVTSLSVQVIRLSEGRGTPSYTVARSAEIER